MVDREKEWDARTNPYRFYTSKGNRDFAGARWSTGLMEKRRRGFDPTRYAPWNDQYRLSTISTRVQLRQALNRARRGTRSTSKKRIISAKIPDCLLAFNDGISFNLYLYLFLSNDPLTLSRLGNLFSTFQRLFDTRSPLRNWFFVARNSLRLNAIIYYGIVKFVFWKIIDFVLICLRVWFVRMKMCVNFCLILLISLYERKEKSPGYLDVTEGRITKGQYDITECKFVSL